MFSIVYFGGYYITGGNSGALYHWKGGIGSKINAHKGKVQTLVVSKTEELYSGS